MNIIITGASKGIGAEIAKIYGKQNHNLLLISRNKQKLEVLKKELEEVGTSEISILPFDLLNLKNESDMFMSAVPFKHVDILINNAGYLANELFVDSTDEEVERTFQVNFFAPAQLIKSLIDRMGGDSSTHIVNVSSMGGFQGASKYPGLSYYSASKAAIATLTECLATEFNDKNIAVNCLCLGAVQTEMLSEAFPDYKAPVQAQEMADYIADFALKGNKFYNGKILPVALSNP